MADILDIRIFLLPNTCISTGPQIPYWLSPNQYDAEAFIKLAQ